MNTHRPIPANFPVQPLKPGQPAADKKTCGHCGLSWDDAISTSWTPAPSARCPFEYFHEYQSAEPDRPTVYITVMGGVVQDVDGPSGLRVVVIDYDDYDDDDDMPELKRDDDGELYFEAVYDL